MPYTGAGDPELPENVQALPEARREQWVAIWNSVFEKCQKGGADDCEAAAFRQANGVVFGKKDVETQQPEREKADAATNALPDSAFLYVESGGDKDEEGKTVPRSLRHLPFRKADGSVDLPRLRNALSRLGQRATGAVAGERWLTDAVRQRLIKRARGILEKETKSVDEPDRFSVYKQADGSYRWASVSSVAVKDKEFEIVTEQAYDDAIEHAQEMLDFGGLDLVHVDGTVVGKCDLMARAGKQLVESGTFDDTEIARGAIKAIQDDPDYWGVSIKFVYDPSKFDGEQYNGNIRIKARTILPQEMAASYGTRLVAIGGENPMSKELSKQAREALQKLNVPEEDIEKLAEKQVEPEPNTVEKGDEETQPETVEVEKTLWNKIKSVFSVKDAETGGEEVAEVEPVEAQEKVQETELSEVVKGLFDVYTGATVEAVQSALAQRDKQIAALGEAILALNEQVKALQGPIEDKIEKRLAELPRIVKTAPSQTAAVEQPAGRTLPHQNKAATDDFVGELMQGVQSAVEQVTRKFDKVQV